MVNRSVQPSIRIPTVEEDYYTPPEHYLHEGSTMTSSSEGSVEGEVEDQAIVKEVNEWLKALLENCES